MPSVHHITLTVSDIDASVAWYQRLLGPATLVHRSGPGWVRTRMEWPGGLIMGVTRHESTPPERFDHARIGLDHIGLACADEAEVRGWHDVLEQMGAPHGPVEDVPYGWAVTGRDPDGIAIEFFCPRT